MRDLASKDEGGAQAIAAALRLIKDLLYTLGAEGDEAIQRLLAAEGALRSIDDAAAEAATFYAFHAGFAAQERLDPSAPLPDWPGESVLRPAYETGALAARLNTRSRAGNLSHGWNVGPFDHPDVRGALERAERATMPPAG
jgi:hypothetical protein